MGIGGISIWQLVIILAIIILLFGTKKLRNIGGDLGNAVKGFKKAVSDDNTTTDASTQTPNIAQKEDEAKPTNSQKEQDKV
ncbi:sec-independent protein translocase protein TatA [Pseudoalteromonas ulvae UL12]|uniref:Sec-independent protein translocase protein TatA n=1 Tax=Pseudoalteromonas ulvae TaxID=107327 RepID=A0A244CVU4_PSEDV|nr:Sec-independent protein translocase subunit TatA [Pseudoalteromonas ulvae]MBE0364795.1 sec-independent protein translocase protein TatA [Pseudoalteromonas ulvae UL12]OUL59750.1 Sec-independent protein translocase TatA [Pseudoalteromonas ulvae]